MYHPETRSFDYYIYALRDPRTQEVRYVGQTVHVATRYGHHIHTTKTRNPLKNAWMAELKSEGLRPSMEILQECSEQEASSREHYWMAYFLQNGQHLTNLRLPNGTFPNGKIRWTPRS